jgi:DNA invertase Pin-like site-specific DNA recombinase
MTAFPKLPKGRRGIIYARVSTEEQQKSGYSIPSQIKLCREKMKIDGVEEVHEPIIDVDSGRDFERKGLKEVVELAYAKRFDLLYVLDLDRLGRHVAETPYLMWNLKENGVIVSDIKQEYNFDDPTQYVLATMICARAHAESDHIGERTQRGKKEKVTQGMWVGPPPFGYRKNNDKLEKIPELEPIIHDIFMTYKALHNLKKTALTIGQKYENKIGSKSPAQIRAMLINPVTDGRPTYGKTQIEAPELRIVPPDLFAHVQRLLESKRKHKGKESKEVESILDMIARESGTEYLLKVIPGLRPICPKCGKIMVSNGSKLLKRLNIKVPNFRCSAPSCNGQKTVPSEKEMLCILKNHVSCPLCRSADCDKTVHLDSSTKYVCRRCSTSFQFTLSKEAEDANEQSNQGKKDHYGCERPFVARSATDSLEEPQNTDQTLLEKAVKFAISAGFQLTAEAFELLQKIVDLGNNPLKVMEDAVNKLAKLPTKPFFIQRSDLSL